MPKLKNAKQEMFCQEYLIDLNATAAAIRAGYSPKSAGSIASENLKKPNIALRVEELKAKRSKRTGVTADRVIAELAKIGFVNATEVIDFDDATIKDSAGKDDTAAIQSVRVKVFPTSEGDGVEREIRLADKNKALEQLGRHLGLFTDKVDLSGDLSMDIKIDYGDDDSTA